MTLADNKTALQLECDNEPTCVAFNTDGFLKDTLKPSGLWSKFASGHPHKGMYVRSGLDVEAGVSPVYIAGPGYGYDLDDECFCSLPGIGFE